MNFELNFLCFGSKLQRSGRRIETVLKTLSRFRNPEG